MAKGRDTWDYLAYYLQLFDSEPPLSELQLFRTPLTPIVVGLPLDLGGIWLLEVVFGLLYATSILAWSATALSFGRIPALFTRAPAARLSGVRDALPPGLERRRVRDRARGLGAAADARPATGRRRRASSRSGPGSPFSS